MAKNLMIQGTMSGVGKSILTAGILRVLHQDGYRVAPFKSQNMALNSFVTKEGREIGRAQALQAYAAGMEPSSDMNPILLKPMGDTTSQVIVNGLPVANMKAADYFRKKTDYIPEIKRAYDRLSANTDVIVIEGAGSPVEINLRENDIVNMGLAQILDAPVLLAGNIDPGGVFAQLLGTINLMSEAERKRVKGLIINKFRGDKALLEPGLSMFRPYCDIPFAGVVPFVPLDLDEEDSVSERLTVDNRGAFHSGKDGLDSEVKAEEVLKIAVIRLPFISNYTDFTIFDSLPFVELRYVNEPKGLEEADLVVIPGTKNTLADLKWLKDVGLSRKIKELLEKGTPVVGICGGFQMLGRSVSDPEGMEGGGTLEGLGLLPMDTRFEDRKELRQVNAAVGKLTGFYESLSGTAVEGYEIHMGESTSDHDIFPVLARGAVLGTYIHGIFDSPEFTRKLMGILCEKKGINFILPEIEPAAVTREKELDKLADVLRENLDFDLIYEAIGL